MAIGAQEIERGPGNLRASHFYLIARINGNHVNAQQVAEAYCAFRRRRLPDHQEAKSRVVQLLKQILGGTSGPELEPQPREPIARARRAIRQTLQ